MSHDRVWRRLAQPCFGLADRISDAIGACESSLPGALSDIRLGKEVLVACDIGGDHSEASYRAFGYLISEVGSSRSWMEQRAGMRGTWLRDGRRMSYKDLGDRVRRAALPRFLQTASLLQGNLVVFLVSRDIRTLFSDPGDLKLLPELVVAERGWSRRSFARLLTVGTFGALLVGGLADYQQDVLWLTDQDEIAPNATKHNHAGHVIGHCIERYVPEKRGQLVFVTTEGTFDRCFREDLVAIPDLSAGALVEAFSMAARTRRLAADFACLPGVRLSGKAQAILQWLSSGGGTLRPIVVLLQPAESGIDVVAYSPAPHLMPHEWSSG